MIFKKNYLQWRMYLDERLCCFLLLFRGKIILKSQ